MLDTNYIVAIDLGTSRLSGVVGEKLANGNISVIAKETVEAPGCFLRGHIHNQTEAAAQMQVLIGKLEDCLKKSFQDNYKNVKITGAYIGVNDLLLRSLEQKQSESFHIPGSVTERDIQEMTGRCEAYKPQEYNILGTTAPMWYLDDRFVSNPLGAYCEQRIEARFKAIVGPPASQLNAITHGIELKDCLISLQTLAEIALSQSDKEKGCAFVHLGRYVTSVAVYKTDELYDFVVIPLGSHLITKDLAAYLEADEAIAEDIKVKYGIVSQEYTDINQMIPVETKTGTKEVALGDIGAVIESRAREIIGNVYARIQGIIESFGGIEKLEAGFILTGNAAKLKNLTTMIKERYESNVRISSVPETYAQLDKPYISAVSVMLKGENNCVSYEKIPVEAPPSDPKGPKGPPVPKKKISEKMMDLFQNAFITD